MPELTEIAIDQMATSPLRKKGRPVPQPSASSVADAIQNGITDLVVVRKARNPLASPRFEILRGIDVWILAQRVGVDRVPSMVVLADDEEASNLINTDAGADPITTAEAMQALMDRHGWDITSLGRQLRMPRTSVSNHLRLLKLNPEVQDLVKKGDLTMRHAKLLLRVPQDRQLEIAELVVSQQMSTRRTAALVGAREEPASKGGKKKPASTQTAAKDPDTLRLETRLGEILGTKVSIDYEAGGKGTLTMDFYSFEGLEGVLERIGYSEF